MSGTTTPNAPVRALVLVVRESSVYADTPTAYEFPSQYLKYFQDVGPARPVLALIYEPQRGHGRRAFVAWTWINTRPEQTPDGLFRVRYADRIRSFDQVVPLRWGGEPVERALREIPKARLGSYLQGRSVRDIPLENAMEILQVGMKEHGHAVMIPGVGAPMGEARTRSLVERFARSAKFRDEALERFEFTCAISGLRTSAAPASRIGGLLEAAHIQPVSQSGSDEPGNALVLTPTVHRLFDAGYFTLERDRRTIVIRTSSHLANEYHQCPERGTVIRIEDGVPLLARREVLERISDESIRHHNREVYLGRAS